MDMDEIDIEIKQMLESLRTGESEITDERYKDIKELQRDKARVRLEDYVKSYNGLTEILGGEVHLVEGTFKLYTRTYEIYSGPFDNFVSQMLSFLSNSETERLHNKDNTGLYFYIPYKPIKAKLTLQGRILKHFHVEAVE